MIRFLCVGWMCVGVCLGAARAQTPPKADDDLNDLMALRSKVMIEAYQLQMEIRQMWSDPAYTSPEIEALRKKHKALQEEILRTQTEIGAKVEALPELQPKVKKLEETNKRVEELNKKIEEKMR